jgi:hypothetical protein
LASTCLHHKDEIQYQVPTAQPCGKIVWLHIAFHSAHFQRLSKTTFWPAIINKGKWKGIKNIYFHQHIPEKEGNYLISNISHTGLQLYMQEEQSP